MSLFCKSEEKNPPLSRPFSLSSQSEDYRTSQPILMPLQIELAAAKQACRDHYLWFMKIDLPVVDRAQQFIRKNDRAIKSLYGAPNLDQEIRQVHAEVFSEIDCLQCANCCKTTGPLFTQQDIERLAKHFQQKPGIFIQKYLQMDEDGDFVLQSLPCPFLNEDNTCSVYEIRPRACRDYPHTDQVRQKKLFALTMKNMEICPAVLEIFHRVIKD